MNIKQSIILKKIILKTITTLSILFFSFNYSIAQRPPSGPTYVEYTPIQLVDKKDKISAVGILLPAASVIIKPELSNKIASIHFIEGQNVQAGDVLIKLDDTSLQADFKDASAKVFLAEQNLKRFNAVKASSTLQQIDTSKAALMQAQAALAITESQLAKTIIKAPFSGTTNLSDVEVGEYVQTGAELLTIVNQDQLKLEFNVPERIAHLVQKSQKIQFNTDNFPDQFNAIVYAANAQIEQQARSLTVRAWVDNKQHRLIPGLFARLTLIVPQDKKIMQLPEESMFAQNGKQWVYVVSNQNTQNTQNSSSQYAKLAEITVLSREFGFIEFESSTIKMGDIIVKSGQQKLIDGSEIKDISMVDIKKTPDKIKE